MQPGWARRWALVLMHTLVPYALERVAPSARQGERESEEHASSFAPGVPRSLRESHPDPGAMLDCAWSRSATESEELGVFSHIRSACPC